MVTLDTYLKPDLNSLTYNKLTHFRGNRMHIATQSADREKAVPPKEFLPMWGRRLDAS